MPPAPPNQPPQETLRLVSRILRCLNALRVPQHLIGGLGPHERLTAVVPAVDEPADRGDQISHRWEAATTDRLAGDY